MVLGAIKLWINYATSLVVFVIPVMQLELSSILVQEVVNNPDKEDEILGTTLAMTQILAFLCIIGAIFFSLIANADEVPTIIVCNLYSIVLIFQSIELIQYWFQAKLMFKYVSFTMLGAYIVVSIY